MTLERLVVAALSVALTLPLSAGAAACDTGDIRHLVTLLRLQADDDTVAGYDVARDRPIDNDDAAPRAAVPVESDTTDRDGRASPGE